MKKEKRYGKTNNSPAARIAALLSCWPEINIITFLWLFLFVCSPNRALKNRSFCLIGFNRYPRTNCKTNQALFMFGNWKAFMLHFVHVYESRTIDEKCLKSDVEYRFNEKSEEAPSNFFPLQISISSVIYPMNCKIFTQYDLKLLQPRKHL